MTDKKPNDDKPPQFDDVLRRMLATPPAPNKKASKPTQSKAPKRTP